ncbi:Rho guanine nucleotide exchange factor 4 [Globomyces sp. JEL0801]|nr:Rho guanine nucleotide exchange factor 4 [Globomyces sp. JEL0801]
MSILPVQVKDHHSKEEESSLLSALRMDPPNIPPPLPLKPKNTVTKQLVDKTSPKSMASSQEFHSELTDDLGPLGQVAFAIVRQDYTAKNIGELTLEETDIVEFYPSRNKNGLMYGCYNGLRGWFPETVVTVLTDAEVNEVGFDVIQKEDSQSILNVDPDTSPSRGWYSKIIKPEPELKKQKSISSVFNATTVSNPAGANGIVILPTTNTTANTIASPKKPFNRAPGQRMLWVDFMGGAEEVAKLKMEKQEIKRQEVIFEIITTEADFVEDLETICELYIRPLQKNKLIRPKDMAIIFSNIEQVLPVNQVKTCLIKAIKELLRELEKRQSVNPIVNMVGDVFIRVEMIRATDPSHPDMENLNKALLKIETVVTTINEGARHTENVHKMIELQSKFVTKINIVAASRTIVKSGPICALNAHGEKKKREIYIFNDMLILTKQDGDKYKLLSMVPFDDLTLHQVSVGKDAIDIPIEILQLGKVCFTLVCDSFSNRELWVKPIQKALAEYVEQKNRITTGIIQTSTGGKIKRDRSENTLKQTTSEIQKEDENNIDQGSISSLNKDEKTKIQNIEPVTASEVVVSQQPPALPIKPKLNINLSDPVTQPIESQKSVSEVRELFSTKPDTTTKLENIPKPVPIVIPKSPQNDKLDEIKHSSTTSARIRTPLEAAPVLTNVSRGYSTSAASATIQHPILIKLASRSQNPQSSPSKEYNSKQAALITSIKEHLEGNVSSSPNVSEPKTPSELPNSPFRKSPSSKALLDSLESSMQETTDHNRTSSTKKANVKPSISKPVKKATITEMQRKVNIFSYKINVQYLNVIEPSTITHTFEDFFDLHLQLLGHFPEAAGIKTSEVVGQKANVRILPELPAQMMFVSEVVAQGRMSQLQTYIDILLNLPPKISRSPVVLKFFKE